MIHACLSLLRQFEIYRSRTILVNLRLLHLHLFPTGIYELEIQFISANRHLCIDTLHVDKTDSRNMHGLSRTIDAAVGINLIFSLIIFLFIIAGTAEIDVLGRHKLVIVGRNQHPSIHILEVSLSVFIGRQAGMNCSLVLLRLEIIPLVIKFNLRPGDRLAICSIHHYIAMLIIRQLLDHHRQIAHIEELSLRSDA